MIKAEATLRGIRYTVGETDRNRWKRDKQKEIVRNKGETSDNYKTFPFHLMPSAHTHTHTL